MNNFEKYRTLYLTKLENSPDKDRILTEINEEYRNVNKYFDLNTNIIYKRKPTSLRNIILEKKDFSSKGYKRFTRKTTTNSSQIIYVKPTNSKNDNFERVDANTLRDLFDSFKTKQKNSLIEESKLPPLPKEVTAKLVLQEKTLVNKVNDDYEKTKMGKFLCSKIKKKAPELLMNTIEEFRVNREVVNTFHYRNSLEDKYEKQKWHISLRRPEHYKGIRKILINVSSDSNPLWSLVKDKDDSKKEKLYCYSNELDEMEMNLKRKKKDLLQIRENINTISSLKLDGKNLLQLEFDNAFRLKGPKYIKKPIDTREQKRDENQTLCEHYNISNQKSSMTMSSFNASNNTMYKTTKITQDSI